MRAKRPAPTDSLGIDDLTKKIQADPEILKMERAQIPLYLYLERPDLASAVYADILGGWKYVHPGTGRFFEGEIDVGTHRPASSARRGINPNGSG